MHIMSWLSLLLHISGDDQVESRKKWAAGGSSLSFVTDSPDLCPR